MQARDWIIGFVSGAIVGGIGLLSLIKFLPFEISKSVLIWIAAVGGLLLFYASIVEITNSNIMGTLSIIVSGIALVISILPALSSIGWLGSWAAFVWIGDTFYKLLLILEGIFLIIATFAMEL